jgi:hypothetical protein
MDSSLLRDRISLCQQVKDTMDNNLQKLVIETGLVANKEDYLFADVKA